MQNDSDYGGTLPANTCNGTPMKMEVETLDSKHVPVSGSGLEANGYGQTGVTKIDTGNEVENSVYTDNDGKAALLSQDQNKIWTPKDCVPVQDEEQVKLLENPAYIHSVTSTDNQLISLLKSEYPLEKINDTTSIQESIDDFEGHRKDFDFSIVEPAPHLLRGEPLWESTAYIDEYTCPSPGTRRLERVCKYAIMNLSQDISCKGSMKGSRLLPVTVNQVPEPVPVEEESFFEGNEVKNLIVISVSVALMNAAFSSLRNLQSSLNHKDGVGLYSMTGSCLAFTFLSIFTPCIIQQFRPKRCLILALFTYLLYVGANVIPEFYVLVPASVLQGAGSALLWNAVSTYITYIARSAAIRNDKKTVDIAGKYFGVFFCFFQLSVVVGNLISSVVLIDTKAEPSSLDIGYLGNTSYQIDESVTSYIPTVNVSKYGKCGSEYCHSSTLEHGTLNVKESSRYTLLGIYGMATVLSLILPIFLMDTLKNYHASRVNFKYVAKQGFSVVRCIFEPRFLSCLLIFFYSNMELGFVTAEVTKGFVTCPLGIHMVGYTMICFGVCGSISSFVGGKLEKHVGCTGLIVMATILDVALVAVMLVWQPEPEPSFYYFLLLGAWGIGDGIWMSQVNCVVSRLFPDKLEEAFAALRVILGLGITLSFAYGSSLCMTYKMYILLLVCLVGTVIYVTSEIVRKWCYLSHEKDNVEIQVST